MLCPTARKITVVPYFNSLRKYAVHFTYCTTATLDAITGILSYLVVCAMMSPLKRNSEDPILGPPMTINAATNQPANVALAITYHLRQ